MNRKSIALLSCFLFLILLSAGSGGAAPANGPAAETLNIVWTHDITTLDPALVYDSASIQVVSSIYERLVEPVPSTPEYFYLNMTDGWSVSDDARVYTFHIKKNKYFHNGAALTPADVAYSIQRGLLQSDRSSPQYLLIMIIMGYETGDITQEIAGGAYAGDPAGLRANATPAELLATCNKVKERVVADEAAGTVTVTLAGSNGAFLAILGAWGFVLDAGWAADQGDWDGDCATWQNFYAPREDQGSRLHAVANGTGPFRLESWTPGQSIRLRRHPLPGRASYLPAVQLREVMIEIDPDPSSYPMQLYGGEVDMAAVQPSQYDQLDEWVMLEYLNGEAEPVMRHVDQSMVKLSGLPYPGAVADIFPNFNIPTGGPRNYIGSGQLDGNGIPPDFFADSHVRKAFAYAFDYEAFNDAVYGGQGIRRTGPIVKPLMGYDPAQPVYGLDLAAAGAELAQAWAGQVMSNGFRLTLAYDTNNTARRKAAELLEAGLEALNPKIQIDVIELSPTDYRQDMRSGYLPLAVAGWIADYAHPDNWVRPFLTGTYAQRQNLPQAMIDEYQQRADECFLLFRNEARQCYAALQAKAYADTTVIYTYQTSQVIYAVGGINGLPSALRVDGSLDYASLWQGGTPIASRIEAITGGQGLGTAGASGVTLNAHFPQGSLAEPRVMLLWPDIIAGYDKPAPEGLAFGPLVFSLTDWDVPAARAAELEFLLPATIRLEYTQPQIAPLIEDGLVLMRWDGEAWVAAACDEVAADPAANTLEVPICQTGVFALMGPTHTVNVPVVAR